MVRIGCVSIGAGTADGGIGAPQWCGDGGVCMCGAGLTAGGHTHGQVHVIIDDDAVCAQWAFSAEGHGIHTIGRGIPAYRAPDTCGPSGLIIVHPRGTGGTGLR